jgi:predicted ATPase
MAIHAGEAETRDNDFFGPSLNRVARLVAIGHGGQVLVSAAAAALMADDLPADAGLLDRGEHRLKDLARPEHVYQLSAPGLATDFPPLRSGGAPTNLPAELTSFIGRERESDAIRGLLVRHRLVSLVGVGGTGKTRLLLHVAGELAGRHPDGAWLIELAPLREPGLVAQEVVRALGIQVPPGQPAIAAVTDFLRSKDLLLLLDNCEHLIEAAADFAERLLESCRSVQILATSREALGVPGEATYPVPSMAVPDALDQLDLEAVAATEAVWLFVERATTTLPDFRLDATNVTSVVEICRRLDGIPLALELAAARVNVLSTDEIAQGLGDRFRLLTGGRRTAVPRQQTLQALIDWSHDLLPVAEQVLLRRLSVFAGGWTLEAAEAICAGEGIDVSEVLDLLTRLVEKSLVVLDATEAEPRYRMLQTIRQYAASKRDDAVEGDSLGTRHLEHFRDLAETAEPSFFHPDQLAWYRRIDAELENIRAALEWSSAGIAVETGLRLTMALHRYWYARQYCREAFDWLQRLQADLARIEPRSHAKALFVSSHLLTFFGDRAAARRLAEQSLELSQSLDDREGIVDASWMLGSLHELDKRARAYFEASLGLAREIGYTFGAMHCLTYYGRFEMLQGRYDAAIALLQECEKEARKLGGDLDQLADCRRYLGEIAMLRGDTVGAGALLDQSMALYQEAGSIFGICTILSAKGRLALGQAHNEQAIGYFRESLALRRRFTSPRPVALILAYLAVAQAAANQPITAVLLAGARMALDDGSLSALPEFDDAVAALRTRLDESAFLAAWTEGEAMTMEDAIAYVVDQVPA